MLVGGFIAIPLFSGACFSRAKLYKCKRFFSVGPSEKEGMLPGVPNGHCGN